MAASGRGRLASADAAPAVGERTIALASAAGFTVEQTLSGVLEGPVEYVQDHDEWVLVVDGAATLAVDGTEHELTDGDWCHLSAGVPHVLVRVAPGTRWLAVRGVSDTR